MSCPQLRTGLPPRGTLRGTPRGQLGKKGTCLFSVPNSTRAGPEKMAHACFQFRTLRGHFFLSRHALRRRPISRPTWHSATARRLRLRTLGRTCSSRRPSISCVTLSRSGLPHSCSSSNVRAASSISSRAACRQRISGSLQGFSAQSSTCAAAPGNRPWCRR